MHPYSRAIRGLFLVLKVQGAFFLVGELLARNVGFGRSRAASFTFKGAARCVETLLRMAAAAPDDCRFDSVHICTKSTIGEVK
jgi:hypothetical protein